MSTEVWVALIGAAATIVTVIMQNRKNHQKMVDELKAQQQESLHQQQMASERADAKMSEAMAVMQQKIEDLTRETRKHNNFAEKIPVLEERIKVINHRLDDLEDK